MSFGLSGLPPGAIRGRRAGARARALARAQPVISRVHLCRLGGGLCAARTGRGSGPRAGGVANTLSPSLGWTAFLTSSKLLLIVLFSTTGCVRQAYIETWTVSLSSPERLNALSSTAHASPRRTKLLELAAVTPENSTDQSRPLRGYRCTCETMSEASRRCLWQPSD